MAYNSPILGPSGVGLLGTDGKLTKSARDAFTAQVILLLASGNAKGSGAKISSALGISFPPVPGPKFLDTDRLLSNPSNPTGDLFWFEPSPFGVLTTPFLLDPEKDYQKIIVSNLYEPLVKMLNVPGNIVAPVLFDPTCFFDINVDIPEFLAALVIALPNPLLHASFAAKFGIDVDLVANLALNLPSLPSPPPLPPPLPPIPQVSFDFIVFSDLLLSIFSIPIEILKPDFVISLVSIPVPDPGSIFIKLTGIIIDLVIKALEKAGLLAILPKLLVATMVVLVQNMISMLVCDIVGSVLGTGQVVKLTGKVLGLS